MLFGSIFLTAGLFMGEATRVFIFRLIPALAEAVSGGTTSGDSPPVWFAAIFGGVGLLIMLFGFFLLGYRVTIAQRHSRLHLQRRWFVLTLASVHDLSDLRRLEIGQSGHVNNDPRFSLTAHFKNNQKTKLIGFAPAPDLGQIHARLREHLPPPA